MLNVKGYVQKCVVTDAISSFEIGPASGNIVTVSVWTSIFPHADHPALAVALMLAHLFKREVDVEISSGEPPQVKTVRFVE